MADTTSGGIGATLKQKKGPLPIWAWFLILVALLALYLAHKRKAAAAATQANNQAASGSSTNLGSNTVANLVPTAYPMPFQQGDVFTTVNVPPDTSGTTTTGTGGSTTGSTSTKPQVNAYVWQKGDTWDSVGKKLNIAPVALWEANGAPAGFKVPATGFHLNISGLYQNPDYAYANQAKIVAAEGAIAKSGTPAPPRPGTVTSG